MAGPDTLIDQVFDGRYKVVRKLGTGGMANVYLAEDQELGRRVAIKMLDDRHAQDEDPRVDPLEVVDAQHRVPPGSLGRATYRAGPATSRDRWGAGTPEPGVVVALAGRRSLRSDDEVIRGLDP